MRSASSRCLEFVVGQAATVLQSVLAHGAGELFFDTLAGLGEGVRGHPLAARRCGVMNAIAAQQFLVLRTPTGVHDDLTGIRAWRGATR